MCVCVSECVCMCVCVWSVYVVTMFIQRVSTQLIFFEKSIILACFFGVCVVQLECCPFLKLGKGVSCV